MYKIAVVLVIILIALLFFNLKSQACTPSGPDAWFSEEIEFYKASFPYGISIVNDTPSYSYNNDLHGPVYFIKNSSDIPLYIISKMQSTISPSVESIKKISTKNWPSMVYKIVENKIFFIFTEEDNIAKLEELEWNTRSSNSSTNITGGGVDFPYYNVEHFGGIRINNTYADNRPGNTGIPTEQEFSLHAYYGDKPLDIKGRVKFQLNQNYDPHFAANDSCAHWLAVSKIDQASRLGYNWRNKVFVVGGTAAILAMVFDGLIGKLFFRRYEY